MNALFVVIFMLFIDVFNYWKHYLLHTPTLWIFHEPHH
jgi:sterol desaturase/sphingolipid hydroxylase (fatty acid hydroxylase superfamily)